MQTKSDKLARLLVLLLPKEGTHQLMELSAAEARLQKVKELALSKLRFMDDSPSASQARDWWDTMRELLLEYLVLSEVIQETCAVLGPIADSGVADYESLASQETNKELRELQEKIDAGEVFIVPGTSDIN